MVRNCLIVLVCILFFFGCATPMPKPGKQVKIGKETNPPAGYIDWKKRN